MPRPVNVGRDAGAGYLGFKGAAGHNVPRERVPIPSTIMDLTAAGGVEVLFVETQAVRIETGQSPGTQVLCDPPKTALQVIVLREVIDHVVEHQNEIEGPRPQRKLAGITA